MNCLVDPHRDIYSTHYLGGQFSLPDSRNVGMNCLVDPYCAEIFRHVHRVHTVVGILEILPC